MNHNSIYCPHCRHRTHLTIHCKYSIQDRSHELAECNGCHGVVLAVRGKSSHVIERTYPTALPEPVDEKVPAFLKADMTEAFLCYSVAAYRASAVIARRALQICCLEKKAEGKTLFKQIEDLLDKNIITSEIKDWANEVRMVGNDGAHPTKDEDASGFAIKEDTVTKEDAEDILSFLKQFVQILYIAPALAEERRARRSSTSS